MGKKTKVGKQRKDKFYHLAKEAGYRSRAAFKLIQLNRKFEFLHRSRVLVDLCAAPGGWLQVAQKYMPVSSVLIGIDLVPIKTIANCITLQEDITTPKCRQSLKKELKTWKADVFLHDGAPNVGKSWLHDAFAQAQLTLHALKLASEFLVKGGWFITKVFRSKDYHALLWVFNKLFKKVHATKPQASRHESAEIFVVCQHYLAPDKLDPKFLDPAYVFEEVERVSNAKPILGEKEKKKPKAEGYPEGDYTLFHQVTATEFITSTNHVQLLNDNTEIRVDTEEISNHPATTEEVRVCCKDLKVLGKNELKTLLIWRKKLRPLLVQSVPKIKTSEEIADVVETEDDIVDRQITEAKAAEARESRNKKKKVEKERRKLREKMDLKMDMGSDELMLEDDLELFRLGRLKNKEQLDMVQDQDASIVLSENEVSDVEEDINPRKRPWVHFNKDEASGEWNNYDESNDDDCSGSERLSVSDEDEMEDDPDVEDEEKENDRNPLVVDLDESKRSVADRWFEKEELAGLENDSDEDLEVEIMADAFEKQNTNSANTQDDFEFQTLTPEDNASAKKKKVRFQTNSDDDSDEDDGSNENPVKEKSKKAKRKKVQLGPEGLALGTLMIQSKKTKRDIMDNAYNRYTSNDDNLPDWFVRDEEKHNKKAIPVTAEMMREYRDRLKEINARPIKKIMEAKARKGKRARRIMERARKKAEAVTESLDMSVKEKAQQVQAIYKKVNKKKKDKDVTYVVAKKGTGRRVRRPPGVKGRFKVVDKRLKKDDRKRKATEKMAAKGKRRKSKQGKSAQPKQMGKNRKK